MAGTGPTPDSSSPNPDDINDRLAEIAAELASEAKFKEPTAAERARAGVQPVGGAAPGKRGGPLRRRRNKRLAAELRKPVQDSGGQKTAAPRPARASGRPAGSRPKPSRRAAGSAAQRAGAWPTPDRGYATPTRRPGAGRSVVTLILVLAVLFGLSFGLRKLLQHSPSSATGAKSGRTPAASTLGASSPTPSGPLQTPAFTAADPFAGSPAAPYANGADGIVLPPARPVGPYTSTQVASAYATVKNLLVAADLNMPTLYGYKPTAFGSLLISQQRSYFYAHLTKPVRPKKGQPWLTRTWVTSFAPGTELVGSIVKVHGAPMTATVVSVNGRRALQVFANYLFVYAVEQQGQPDSRLRIVAHATATVQFAQWYDPGGSLQPWIYAMGASYADAQCGTTDGFVHPAFPLLGPGKVTPSGAPVNPYSLAQNQSKGCQAITGT